MKKRKQNIRRKKMNKKFVTNLTIRFSKEEIRRLEELVLIFQNDYDKKYDKSKIIRLLINSFYITLIEERKNNPHSSLKEEFEEI